MIKSVLMFAVGMLLLACAPSSDQVDEHQLISRTNAEYNAKRHARKAIEDVVSVSGQSDSTISADCPYGDGWATIDVKTLSGDEQIKCQTTGSGKGVEGCLSLVEFNQKDYANQEGKCDKSLKSIKYLEEQ